ncbi:MAG: peptidoglycan-binding protein [Rhodobacterales bacterium]|nr:peptidoglycan-binding protein [Rhodobacterales bacterium]
MRAALFALCLATPAGAAPCGGDFGDFLQAMEAEAIAAGTPADKAAAFFAGARIDENVLKADRSQGFFRKTFLDFSQSLISKNRLTTARAKSDALDDIFTRAEAEYGVSRGMLLAFWAFETDFVDLDTTGAWAGEIGMVQMLPKDILERGVDGDGDGLILLKTSEADAILSGARMLQHHGWRPGEPWLTEITLPQDFDWALTGLETERLTEDWTSLGVTPRGGALSPGLSASILLPQGRKGPAFLVYPNYRVLFQWNKSFIYVTTAAYFATRIEGAEPYAAGSPDPALSLDDMTALQEKLAALGHDVGQIDGILGAGTRAAVQKEQVRLGLPADGWPTQALLDAL